MQGPWRERKKRGQGSSAAVVRSCTLLQRNISVRVSLDLLRRLVNAVQVRATGGPQRAKAKASLNLYSGNDNNAGLYHCCEPSTFGHRKGQRHSCRYRSGCAEILRATC